MKSFVRRSRKRLQASVKARQQDEAEEFVREEKDAELDSGVFDQWDAESRRDPSAPRRFAKPKPDLKAKRNSYVRRGGKFVPASTVKLFEGENLYWYRKRKFGQTEKFIPFARVERRKETSK